MSNEIINKSLGLRDLPTVTENETVTKVSDLTDKQQFEVDSDYARDNLYDVLARSQNLVDELTDFAKSAQTAKSYEILNSAIKTLAEVSMSLIEVHQRKAKVKKDEQAIAANLPESERNSPTQIVDNSQNVFVGSTAELQEIIQAMREKKKLNNG